MERFPEPQSQAFSGRDSRRRSRPSDWSPPDIQRQRQRPPGVVGSVSAASSAANNYNHISLTALMNAPSREDQPHLHPRKLNGALWFGVDPSVCKFIRTTWKNYYMGPWRSWKHVPDERKETWWKTFVQQYYWEKRFDTIVYYLWKKETMTSIGERISKKHRNNQKPKYIGEDDWNIMLEYWDTEHARKISQSAANSRNSNNDGLGVHKHCAGPRSFSNIEYQMMLEAGLDEPPPYTELVRKTHTRKDGTFIDPRAESIVVEVEQAATQITSEDDSPNGISQTASSAPSRILLNKEYIKRGKSKRGNIYGIGSVQYRDINPAENVTASLTRNLDVELRLDALESNFKSISSNVEVVKGDILVLKDDFKSGINTVKEELAATRVAMNAILESLGINIPQVNRTQPSVRATQTPLNPTVADTHPPSTNNKAATTPSTENQDRSTPSSTNSRTNLDQWCASLGL